MPDLIRDIAHALPKDKPVTTWNYPAVVEKVIDGDTIRLRLDLGLHIWRIENCRIAGINAPEVSTPEGQAAKAYAEKMPTFGAPVTFTSKDLDKYGRPLGSLTYVGYDFARLMLDAGHAVEHRP